MGFLIFLGALLFALIGIGIGAFVVKRKSYSFRDIQLNSTTLKTGAIFLILINAYSFINRTKGIFLSDVGVWIGDNLEASLRACFDGIFSLAIILLYISIGIFLLLRNFKLAFGTSLSALVFTLFNSIFLAKIVLINAYIALLPIIAVLLSLLFAFVAINGNPDIFHRYSNWLKFAPYLMLLGAVNSIFSLISLPSLNFPAIINSALLILRFLAFLLILNALTSFLPKKSTTSQKYKVSKKEAFLVTLSFLIFPVIIYLISSIDKTWLFVGGVALAVVLPFAFSMVSSKKAKVIAAFVALAIVVAFCLVANILPENHEKFDPNKCYWCEGEGFVWTDDNFTDLIPCSHCHGTGKRN